ncbi:Mpp10 protein-domain-containing protein, partial [Schizophyllum fasciatum]
PGQRAERKAAQRPAPRVPRPANAPATGKGKNKDEAKTPPSSKTGGVRFHDEVRVKSIKKRGRGLPVNYDPEGHGDEDGDDDGDYHAGGQVPDDSEEDEEAGMDEDESDIASSLDGLRGKETIDRLKNDLFADEEDGGADAADLTAHERRQAALRAQIAALKAENVGAKDWALLGEADARQRPQNALLEEDLAFERRAKAAPAETADAVRALEARIPARVLAGDYDHVVRVRGAAAAAADRPFLPSRLFELQDKKSERGLAEIYEAEYVAARGGAGTGSSRRSTSRWTSCGRASATSSTRSPTRTLRPSSPSLESAFPTALSTSTMLAPEDIHAPAVSALRARSELTPADPSVQVAHIARLTRYPARETSPPGYHPPLNAPSLLARTSLGDERDGHGALVGHDERGGALNGGGRARRRTE